MLTVLVLRDKSGSDVDGTLFVGMLTALFVDMDFVDLGTVRGCFGFEGVVTNFSTFPSDLRGLWSR